MDQTNKGEGKMKNVGTEKTLQLIGNQHDGKEYALWLTISEQEEMESRGLSLATVCLDKFRSSKIDQMRKIGLLHDEVTGTEAKIKNYLLSLPSYKYDEEKGDWVTA